MNFVEVGRNQREEKFIRWLDEIKNDAQVLFLMGDLFDFWHEWKHVIPKGYVRVLGKLAELKDSGIQLFMFVGNHDLWMKNYFEEENRILYKKIRQIRNEVMHPSLSSYTYADFLEQEKTINSFVNVFSQEKNLPQLILELHQAEKTKLINIIEKNVIIPALSCEFLPENIIKSIKNTRTR